MKILIAPNAFKETLTARQVCDCLAEGLRSVSGGFEIEAIPLADGGDGTLEVWVDLWGGRIESFTVVDPLGRAIGAPVGFDRKGERAIVEMARASGLALLRNEERNPLEASSFGTGEAVLAAIREGAREIFLGIGGSATNDGGAGMGAALGYAHLDASGRTIHPTGGYLDRIVRILPPPEGSPLGNMAVTVLSDVDNPLCGERGASRVYGPQKGANAEQVERLDRNLAHLAEIWKRDLGKDVAETPGSGAAGGMGGGAIVYLDARLVSGTDLLFEMTGLADRVRAADVVVTGEGALDRTSLAGKIPGRTAGLAKRFSKPCYGVCGVLKEPYPGEFHSAGFTEILEIAPREIPLADRIARAGFWVKSAGRRLGERLSGRDGG